MASDFGADVVVSPAEQVLDLVEVVRHAERAAQLFGVAAGWRAGRAVE